MTGRLAAALLAVAVIAGCGGTPAPRVELPATKPPIVITIGRFDPSAAVPVVSDEVSFPVEGHTVPATIVHPTTGVWPAIVLMAGSGPTDRDWNSPLLPNKNGSGKLLAEALAKHGAVVIRFDKAAVGGNKLAADQVTLDTSVDEARGALTFLRGPTSTSTTCSSPATARAASTRSGSPSRRAVASRGSCSCRPPAAR